jgi:hypothetical protein
VADSNSKLKNKQKDYLLSRPWVTGQVENRQMLVKFRSKILPERKNIELITPDTFRVTPINYF